MEFPLCNSVSSVVKGFCLLPERVKSITTENTEESQSFTEEKLSCSSLFHPGI